MGEYRHHVSGFFAHRQEAVSAFSRLVERGMSRERLQIFATDPAPANPDQQVESNAVLADVLIDGVVGSALGSGFGALAEVALATANVSLFIASPLIAPLMLLGWGASLGGLIGAAAGATDGDGNKEGWFSDLIRDAIVNGQVVLVVETQTEQETVVAREVIQALVNEYKDISMV